MHVTKLKHWIKRRQWIKRMRWIWLVAWAKGGIVKLGIGRVERHDSRDVAAVEGVMMALRKE